ncbi:fluoride efflux transporter CrcB [Snodgrassella sp. CFCC 13594]|uniref:fluoride efflux transporter CrcB n=1 Tax=Snodgrassella sp. CFCC 13594 TaxID=1775559 RepID=UPI000832F716|nr:fluoride efflux transporter CrcB [Snodgrassella sp. CFCC 13594]
MWASIAAIALGGAIGSVLRWLLGNALNSFNPNLPYGTLTANWVGAYIIGVAMAFFANLPSLSPEWRLFIITGFLGGLTTFSTFSAESVTLLQSQRFGWAALHIALHLGGSLLLTTLGILTLHWFKAA